MFWFFLWYNTGDLEIIVIAYDIKRFYREGKIGGSSLNQFRYSLKENRSEVEQLVNDIYDRKIGFADSYSIGDLPYIYINLFGIPNLNIVIQPKHAYFNMASIEKVKKDKVKMNKNDHVHNIKPEKFVDLLYKLEDPLAIYNDNNGKSDKPRLLIKLDDRYAAVLELYSDKETSDKSKRRNHAIITMFDTTKTKDGKKRKTSYYKNYDERILYKKEASESEALYKITVDRINQNASYEANISDFKNEVNMFLRNPQEFVDHFSNKVRTLVDAEEQLPPAAEEVKKSFSLKEEFNITPNDVAALTSKNVYMAEQVKDLEDIMRSGRTFFKVKQNELYKIYDEIAKEYKINGYSKRMFAENMQILFDYIQDAENPDGITTTTLAMMIANDMIEKAGIKDTIMEEMYNGLDKEIKGTRFKIGDADKADLDGGYADFRRRYFGKLNLTNDGIDVDVKYMELNEKYPNLFPDDITHPAEQLMKIAEVMDMFNSVVDNVYGATKEESAFIIAQEIINKALLERSKDKAYDTKDALRMQDKLRKNTTKTKKAKNEIKEDYQKMLQKIKALEHINKTLEKENVKLENQMGKQMKEFADFAADEKALKRAGKLERENQRLKAKFARQKIAEQQRKSSKERKANIDKIKKLTNNLSRSLLHPDKTHYVPQGLVYSMLEVAKAIDLDSGYRNPDGTETKIHQKLMELQKKYREMQDDGDYAISSEYNETVDKAIGRLLDITQNKRINELLDVEIEEIADIMTIINHELKVARDIINGEKLKDVKEAAAIGATQIRSANREFKKTKWLKNGLNGYLNNMLSSVRVFKRLENYAQDGVMSGTGKG